MILTMQQFKERGAVHPSLDLPDRVYPHRNNVGTGTDTVAYTIAKRTALLDSSGDTAMDKLYMVDGAKKVELSIWGNVEDGGCTVTVLGWQPADDGGASYSGSGEPAILAARILEGVATIGSLSDQTDVHPITQQPLVATTMKAMDTFVVTQDGFMRDTTSVTIYDGGAENKRTRIWFDPLGMPEIFVFLTNFTGSLTRADAGLRRV